MSRAIAVSPLFAAAFAAALALSALTWQAGIASDDAARLWTGAIAAADGEVSLGRIVASYPSIPFLGTAAIQALAPAGAPAPALLAALLLGLIAAIWWSGLRETGLGFVAATLGTALLALHPAMLRAAVAGPAEILFALFLFLFGLSLFRLRARGNAPDIMATGLSLVGLSFSHPLGACLAIAALPILPLAVRPGLIANSAFSIVLAIVFPPIFCAFAFTYVSWVFPGSGWTFFDAPGESLATWTANLSRLFGAGLTTFPALDAALIALSCLIVAAPILPYSLHAAGGRRPLLAPALVFAAIAVTAAPISVATGLFGDPSVLAVAAPVLAAIVCLRNPVLSERPARMIAFLCAGYVGGALALVMIDPRSAGEVQTLLRNPAGDIERADALMLGGALAGCDHVLVDTDNAPLVTIGRGSARGLIGPGDERFALALMFARADAAFVALPAPHSVTASQDRLTKAFPKFHRDGAPGYRLAFQNRTWRLYARETGRP